MKSGISGFRSSARRSLLKSFGFDWKIMPPDIAATSTAARMEPGSFNQRELLPLLLRYVRSCVS